MSTDTLPGRLKVLLVNSLYTPCHAGGAEIVTEMLAQTLARAGHRVSVFTSCSREEGSVAESRDGVQVYRFFPPNLWWLYERFEPGHSKSAAAKMIWRLRDSWNEAVARHFGTIVEQVQPDIIHTHNIKGLSPAIWNVAAAWQVKLVHTAHSYEMICGTGLLRSRKDRACPPAARCAPCRVQSFWYGRQARVVDLFCSPSDYLLQAHREAGFPMERYAVVRNGVAAAGLAARPGRRPDEPVRFLYIGQLTAHKGVRVLLEMLRLTSRAFCLSIAGEGELSAAVRERAAADRRIEFHGFVAGEQKAALFAGADALIFPSIWVENAPLAILEALRRGIPVLGSALGAIPEMVQDGVNGKLFEPDSPASLAAAMDAFCAPGAREALESGAALSGKSLPTAEAMSERYLELYRSLLMPSRGQAAPAPAERELTSGEQT